MKRSDALHNEGMKGVFLNLTCALDYIYLTPTLDIADAIFKQFYEFFWFIFLFFTLENETRGSNHNLQVIHYIVHCQVSLLSLKLIFNIVTKLSPIGSINGSLCSRYLWRGYTQEGKYLKFVLFSCSQHCHHWLCLLCRIYIKRGKMQPLKQEPITTFS